MDPEVWGNYGWKFLHITTLTYPECPTNIDKKSMKKFFESIKGTLPCYKCRIHYQEHLQKYPLTDDILSSRKNLIYWLIDIHNSVNRSLGKRELSYEEAIKSIEKIVNGNNEYNMYNYILYIIVIIFIILILFSISLFFNK